MIIKVAMNDSGVLCTLPTLEAFWKIWVCPQDKKVEQTNENWVFLKSIPVTSEGSHLYKNAVNGKTHPLELEESFCKSGPWGHFRLGEGWNNIQYPWNWSKCPRGRRTDNIASGQWSWAPSNWKTGDKSGFMTDQCLPPWAGDVPINTEGSLRKSREVRRERKKEHLSNITVCFT